MAVALVTGSRIWTNPVPVIVALNLVWHATYADTGDSLRVMEGRCPLGADKIAGDWVDVCQFPGTSRLSRPARWSEHGPACSPLAAEGSLRVCRTPRASTCNRAGFRRNTAMVEEVAAIKDPVSLCLAFIRDASTGATHCRDEALRFGLSTFTFGWDSWPDDLREFAESLQEG